MVGLTVLDVLLDGCVERLLVALVHCYDECLASDPSLDCAEVPVLRSLLRLSSVMLLMHIARLVYLDDFARPSNLHLLDERLSDTSEEVEPIDDAVLVDLGLLHCVIVLKTTVIIVLFSWLRRLPGSCGSTCRAA